MRTPCRSKWVTTILACLSRKKRRSKAPRRSAIFGFSLLFVFLILAALYESWSLPFSVLLSTPVAVFGTLGALYLRRSATAAIFPPSLVQIENNVFAQIGLVMIIGLVAKNAILIVEFAKVEHERGATLADAALAGARLRLRPILMTSFAFIAGCVPLALGFRFGSSGSTSPGHRGHRGNARRERHRHLFDSVRILYCRTRDAASIRAALTRQEENSVLESGSRVTEEPDAVEQRWPDSSSTARLSRSLFR